MIYTGNNGRIYIARRQASGLSGTVTVTVRDGLKVDRNESFLVANINGDGSGAVFRANTGLGANATSRSVTFTVTSAGTNYQSGDVVRLYRIVRGTRVDITNNFTVSAALTIGVDSEREILDDQYRIAKVRDWTLNSNSEVIETTALGDTVKTYSPSVTSGDGSATLMFYEDEITSTGEDRMKDTFELVDLLFPRSTPPRVILNLSVDGSTSGSSGQVGGAALWKTNFLFNAYITSSSVGVSYGEVVTINTSFTVDGPLLDLPWKPGVVRL